METTNRVAEKPLDLGVHRYTIELIRDGKNGPETIQRQVVNNLVTSVGKREILRLAAGLLTENMDHMRIGTSPAAAASNQADVLSPVAGTQVTVTTKTMDGRTLELMYSYESSAGSISAAAIQEVAILGQITSDGASAYSRAVFSSVNKTTADKLKITYQVRIT